MFHVIVKAFFHLQCCWGSAVCRVFLEVQPGCIDSLHDKTEVTVKTGATYDGSFMCEWFGKGIPLGSCPIFAKHEKKLELLCNAGYDMRLGSEKYLALKGGLEIDTDSWSMLEQSCRYHDVSIYSI